MIARQRLCSDETLVSCTYCQRAFPEGKWFARLWRNGRPLEFCRPRCVELFLDPRSQDDEGVEDQYVPIRF